VLATCRDLGIRFVAYSPLGRGFLTGRFRSPDDLAPNDWRRNNPRFQGENFQKNLDLVAKVEALAARRRCTPAQLAIAWLLARGSDIVPIPGSTRRERVEENAAAVAIALTPEEQAELDAVGRLVAGQRYPEGGMRAVNR
jgi:aryl-alcohol dehydrogenase-like predicted oxidoreductase